jgi:hypothetical protein
VVRFNRLFVWIGAAAEAGTEQVKSSLHNAAAGQAMLTDFQVLAPEDTLSHAIELTLAGSQKDFPVLVDAAMVGVLISVTENDQLVGIINLDNIMELIKIQTAIHEQDGQTKFEA